jgi:hypothetical protein
VLTCMWTAPSCDSSTTITLWHIDAGSGRRPPHQNRECWPRARHASSTPSNRPSANRRRTLSRDCDECLQWPRHTPSVAPSTPGDLVPEAVALKAERYVHGLPYRNKPWSLDRRPMLRRSPCRTFSSLGAGTLSNAAKKSCIENPLEPLGVLTRIHTPTERISCSSTNLFWIG